MKLIFGLMLLKTAACVERNCSFNQADPCYAALGDKLNLLMVDTSRYNLKIQKRISNTDKDPACRVKDDTMKECDLYKNRPEVSIINGILIINGVIRADSGIYRLDLDGSDGKVTSRDLQVIVEAPIGSVEVSIICCSSGVMRASCSSDGDPLLFSWTLNGDPLMGGNIIELDEGTDGNISCSVKNHVSHRQKTVRLRDLQRVPQGLKCLEFNCSFNQADPCYTALGHKLSLLMVPNARYDLKIQKIINNRTQDDPVCRVKNDRMKYCDLFNDRPEVSVINGTLIINGVIRADSGIYILYLENSDGTETSTGLQVIVEAPIGSVEVSIICSSSGVMRASCSSDGDPLLFSWTLNGDPLMDGNIIELDEGTDGNISCSVKNHISHQQKTIRLVCPDGLEFNCSFNQSDLCYAALGHKLNLLMVDASRYDLKIHKRINYKLDDLVCRLKNGRIRENECDLFNNRPEVSVINGILIISGVIRADSRIYRLDLDGSDGTVTSLDLQVIVEGTVTLSSD